MKVTTTPSSPQNLQTPMNQAEPGASINHTRLFTCIPVQVYHHLYQMTPRSAGPEKPGKHRTKPAVWEAKTELFRRGFSAYPIRGTGPVVLDLIAWDERTVYGIAVRRTRGPATLHPVTAGFAPLIRDLQALKAPGPVEIQLWIATGGRFHVYRVLPGGIMARNMP